MKLGPKRITLALAGVALAAGAVFLLRPTPVAVEAARVTRGTLQVTVDEEGQTRVRDRYVVAAPVAGRVARITLREGDSVESGAIVARMYPAPLDPRAREEAAARLREAEDASRAADAGVTRARAAYQQAVRSRQRAVGAGTAVAAEQRERAELEESTNYRELESADFRAKAAKHDVEVARAVLHPGDSPLELRAPLSGRVLRVPEASERVVSAGAPLIEIGDPAALEVVADLLSSDAVQVHAGDRVMIEGWGGKSLAGRVRVVEPSGFTKVSALGVEEQRVNVVTDFVDTSASLGDRYRVIVRIVVWENPNVLKLPGSALFRDGDRWSVFVVEGSRVRRRDVTVGHHNAFETEIVAGVREGDIVVRHPSDRVSDGVRVALKNL